MKCEQCKKTTGGYCEVCMRQSANTTGGNTILKKEIPADKIQLLLEDNLKIKEAILKIASAVEFGHTMAVYDVVLDTLGYKKVS